MRGKQPAVQPESVSWCIDQIALRGWDYEGIVLSKAHRIREKEVRPGWIQHIPICGAPVSHLANRCIAAPEKWPACRHCAKKLSPVSIPKVFFT